MHADVVDCFVASVVGVLRERPTKEKHSAQSFSFAPEEFSHGLSPLVGQEFECFAPKPVYKQEAFRPMHVLVCEPLLGSMGS